MDRRVKCKDGEFFNVNDSMLANSRVLRLMFSDAERVQSGGGVLISLEECTMTALMKVSQFFSSYDSQRQLIYDKKLPCIHEAALSLFEDIDVFCEIIEAQMKLEFDLIHESLLFFFKKSYNVPGNIRYDQDVADKVFEDFDGYMPNHVMNFVLSKYVF